MKKYNNQKKKKKKKKKKKSSCVMVNEDNIIPKFQNLFFIVSKVSKNFFKKFFHYITFSIYFLQYIYRESLEYN